MTGRVTAERVAEILRTERVCDVVLAARLGCGPGFIAGVRLELGMPSFPIPEPSVRLARPVTRADRDRFEELSVVVEGGHREWLGRHNEDGTPEFNSRTTAYRVAFRIEHDEEPVGTVRHTCVHARCVEPLHLSDRLMRERAAAARTDARIVADAAVVSSATVRRRTW